MNRREFTASLGALSGAAALPLSALPVAATASPPVSSATYAWAKLIVQAQAKADPAYLARYLKLQPDVAQTLFNTLIRNGVLRTTGGAGLARAVEPLPSGTQRASLQTVRRQARTSWQHVTAEAQPLVKEEPPALECGEPVEKEATDARTHEPLQESPRRG